MYILQHDVQICDIAKTIYICNVCNVEYMYDEEGDAAEGRVVCVCREDVLQALNEMYTGKAPGPSEASLELIAASGGVRLQVITEICQSSRWVWNTS